MVELLFHQARRVTGLGVTAVAIALVMAFGFGGGGGTSADGFATKSAPAHAKTEGAVKKGKEKPCEGPAADKNPKCTGERPGNGGGGDGEDADSTCATDGARGGATFAEELAGGGVEENGPLSSQLHSNEASAGEAGVVFHEVSCGVAALEAQAPAEEPPAEEDPPAAEEPPAEDERSDDATCAKGGARDDGATFAEELAGPGLDENGPVSGQIHSSEAQAQQAGPVLHELSCGIAALEGQAPAQ